MAHHPRRAGTTGTFNAAGPKDHLAWGDLLQACRKATSAGHSLTWVSGDWIHRECPDVFPIWAPFMGDTRGFHTWKNARAVKSGLKFRPYTETAADTLRWYKAQPEGGRTKLAGPAPASEAQLLAKWKESRG